MSDITLPVIHFEAELQFADAMNEAFAEEGNHRYRYGNKKEDAFAE